LQRKKAIIEFYRFFQAKIVKRYVLPFWISKESLREGGNRALQSGVDFNGSALQKRSPSTSLLWFHAASVGELESLWPLIQTAAGNGNALILTILSESAQKPLAQLRKQLEEKNAEIIFTGHSPWEGEWKAALQNWKPKLFITAKYEAWPDLWVSLQEEKVPLAMISVRARKSLRIARWFCEKLGFGLPELFLFPCTEEEVDGLVQLLPSSKVQVAGEPRWDRVYARFQLGNQRAKALVEMYEESAKPWGVIGSAWLKDLEFLKSFLLEQKGTLWVVPHRVDDPSIREIENFLKSIGLTASRTSNNRASKSNSSPTCILIDEIGVLSELYSVADWAFVGGWLRIRSSQHD